MTIKLIALDLDGTTLDSRGLLTDKTKAALEEAAKQGVHIVVATGRTFSAVPDEVKNIKGMEYILTSNGAEIRNLKENRLVYSNYIDSDAVTEVINDLKNREFMIEVFVDGIAYTDAYHYRLAEEGKLCHRNTRYVVETRTPLDDIYSFALLNRDKIENINVNFENQEDRAYMREVLSSFDNITLTTSFDHNLEVGGSTTSKAEALKSLFDALDVKAEEIMACGDSPNDGAMLKLAGLAVAMGNGKDEIKAIASYITGTNDEDGVAAAVEKFVLE